MPVDEERVEGCTYVVCGKRRAMGAFFHTITLRVSLVLYSYYLLIEPSFLHPLVVKGRSSGGVAWEGMASGKGDEMEDLFAARLLEEEA